VFPELSILLRLDSITKIVSFNNIALTFQESFSHMTSVNITKFTRMFSMEKGKDIPVRGRGYSYGCETSRLRHL
jgi:hypothetical protein